MKYIAYIVLFFISCEVRAQDSIGAGPTRFAYKFDGGHKELLVYYEGMTSNHAIQFLKELEKNKSNYEEFWKNIPKADRFGVVLECREKCFMLAKALRECHGIDYVSFSASGNLVAPKLAYSHSGKSMEIRCETFSVQ